MKDLLDQQRFATADDLVAWTRERGLDPNVRYAALRRLESVAPSQAVAVAASLLDDRSPLLRENSIAVLVRSQTPAARDALAKLEGRNQRLAQNLAAVRR